MEFEDLIELVRDSYLSQFSTFIDQQAKSAQAGSGEVKLQLSDGAGLYRNYYCADFVAGDDGSNIIELAPDEEVTFEPVDVTLGLMEMRVERLVWNDVNIRSETAIDGRDLSEWFETWFDPDDLTFDPDTRFSGNIHSLTVDEEGVHVDLGTAPVEALVELLLALEDLGYRKVTLT